MKPQITRRELRAARGGRYARAQWLMASSMRRWGMRTTRELASARTV